MKLKITYLNKKEFQGSKGPFISLSIKAEQYGDKYLSVYENAENKNWKVGDEVEVSDVKTVEKNGKSYLNIEMTKKTPYGTPVEVMALSQKLDSIISQNRSIIDHLSGKNLLNNPQLNVPTSVDYPVGEINPEDIPF